MTLPLARQLTINATDPIPSDLLNKLQDAIVGNKKPSLTRVVAPFTMAALGSLVAWTTIGNGYVQSTGAANGLIPLYMETGDRITGVTVSSWGTGAADVTHQLHLTTAAMAHSLLSNVVDSNRAAAWGDFVYGGPFVPYQLNAGDVVYLSIGVTGVTPAGCRIGNIRYTYDRL